MTNEELEIEFERSKKNLNDIKNPAIAAVAQNPYVRAYNNLVKAGLRQRVKKKHQPIGKIYNGNKVR